MRIKYISIFIFWSMAITAANAQKSDSTYPARHTAKSIFFELGGPGFISVNYDQRFKGEKGLGVRAGIGMLPAVYASMGGPSRSVILATFPAELNYLAGYDNHYAEFGTGITALNLSGGYSSSNFNLSSAFIWHVTVGYRYQPARKGINFRVFLSPTFLKENFAFWYGGFSYGYKF